MATILMSENFQLHLLKCSYSECYCNQNLKVNKSRKLRGLCFIVHLLYLIHKTPVVTCLFQTNGNVSLTLCGSPMKVSVFRLFTNKTTFCHVDSLLFLPKDNHREKGASNKTPALTESMNMDIQVVGTSNQLLTRGSSTETKFSKKIK